MKPLLAIVFLCFSVLGICSGASASPNAGPGIWVVPAMERIGRRTPPQTNTHIVLYAARGEYEAFQIIVHAGDTKLKNVNVTLDDLTDAQAHVIAKSNFTLYREKYVRVVHGSPDWGNMSNVPLGAGVYADGLIPFLDPETGAPPVNAPLRAAPFPVRPLRNQPLWVDLFVPRDAAAGIYTSTFTVTGSQGSWQGTVELHVWDFELALKPSLQSEFEIYRPRYETPAVYRELLRHKLMPDVERPEFERELVDTHGLNTVSLPFWSGADISHCVMDPAPSVQQFLDEKAKHQSDVYLYVRAADEINRCPHLFDTVKAWARNLHAAGVDNAIAMAPTTELFDDGSGTGRSAVDLWIVLPVMYEKRADEIAQVRAKGDKVWSYAALVQDSYSPKWEIDFLPMNYRILHGFLNARYGLTGVLYWRADRWGQDPWRTAPEYSNGDAFFPGEGMVVYPGKEVGIQGVVPSIRLKWLREGVEDYEYMAMLQAQGKGDWAQAQIAAVANTWQDWSADPAAVENVRRILGDELAQP